MTVFFLRKKVGKVLIRTRPIGWQHVSVVGHIKGLQAKNDYNNGHKDAKVVTNMVILTFFFKKTDILSTQ